MPNNPQNVMNNGLCSSDNKKEIARTTMKSARPNA